MSSGRLKVFANLANFLQQYHLYRRDSQGVVVRQNDLLMNCLRCLCVSGRDRMCTEEKDEDPRNVEDRWGRFGDIAPGGQGGWMR